MEETNYKKVLAMAKEVREETNVKKVASLLATETWLVIGVAIKNNDTTFSLIRIV